MNNNRTIRLISPKQVIGHFKQHNIELSNAEAEKYLDLLYFSADKIVKQNLLPGANTELPKPKTSNRTSLQKKQ